MRARVVIENVYDNGEIITRAVDVDASNLNDADEWFEQKVFPHTGVGPEYGSMNAYYCARVTASDVPGLVGLTYVWD